MAQQRFPNIGQPGRPWLKWLIAAAAAGAAAYFGFDLPKAPGAEPQAVRVPLPLTSSAAPPSVLRLQHGNSGCSATCIAQEGDVSLVLSCAHCFGGAPSARFRPSARLVSLSDGAPYDAVGIAGDDAADCALLLVKGKIPAAPTSGTLPEVGAAVEHWGITSGHATGKVLPLPNPRDPVPTHLFRSTMSSIPGDSGAGVFSAGKLVAWNWGYWIERTNVQAGTPFAFAAQAAVSSAEVRKLFPAACKAWGAAEPPVQPPAEPPVIEPPVTPPSVNPPTCPPADRRGPIRRFLFPRR